MIRDDAGNFISETRRTKKQAILERRNRPITDGIDRRATQAPTTVQAAFGQRQSHLVSLMAARKKET